MLGSLLAALLSALCYGVAAVMQAISVRAASHRTAEVVGEAGQGVDPGLLVRMLHQGLFLASIAIDLVGFIAQLIALRQLPIFAVQAIMASNLAVTAVFASWLIKIRLDLREWLAVAGVVVGVALLGLSAGAQGAAKVGPEFQFALIVAVVGVGVGGFAVARLPNPVRTPALGAMAGLGYAVLAVAARILPGFGPLPTHQRTPRLIPWRRPELSLSCYMRQRWKAAASPRRRLAWCWPRRCRRRSSACSSSVTPPGPG